MAFFRNAVVTTVTAVVGTTLATALLGLRETGSATAPLNATSHIAWGEDAFEKDDFSPKYTLVGVALNATAMAGWAVVQELLFGRWVRRGGMGRAVVAGTATTALAYATDYHVVPERLTPGFEKRLSPSALAITYGVLTACLAIGARRGR